MASAGDLQAVLKEAGSYLFHDKYFMEYDHSVMDCMEEEKVERTGNRREYQHDCA